MSSAAPLSREKLHELTNKTRRDKQIQVLDELGIPYKVVDGRVIVLECHVQAWMENRPVRASVEPDFSGRW